MPAWKKAVADVFPNASKKIESIIKNIANYQAPGRYVLKPGLEVENSKRHTSEEGRYSLFSYYNQIRGPFYLAGNDLSCLLPKLCTISLHVCNSSATP
ncbi:hypothetical protein SETIT_9G513300v2 [Setaria italica]|uniref:Uncharacterized protein n=1 Tax=Setaria italica TaxID=4555 RepID=A0A368SUS9_SETIT|nr:hypothetical protein SETIT_9G513300v2 [Setaria italica]